MVTILPAELIRSLEKLDHFDRERFIEVHESGEQITSVRFNQAKIKTNGYDWPKEVTEPPFALKEKIPWAENAFYLSKRPSFTLDPLFHAGVYYVQEASGMFLEQALRQSIDLSKQLKVLDLCAAPGGKSTLIQSLISPDSMLVSNEVIKSRVMTLHQNLTKWGFANNIVSNNDPFHFKILPGFFDLMLIDAPCSGSGLFRRDPEAICHWNSDLVILCSQRQQRILADAWNCLDENGILIYSTCSFSKEENEDILDFIFRTYKCSSQKLKINPEWNIIETRSDEAGAYGYRFYPDRLSGEGLFLSVVQKKEPVNSSSTVRTKKKGKKLNKLKDGNYYELIKEKLFDFVEVQEAIHAIPDAWGDEFEIIKNALYLKKAGIRIGKIAENSWIPDHELALGTILSDKVRSLELSKQESLNYLRADPFQYKSAEKGWSLIKYLDRGLGWAKILDNRANNYYPKSWRIHT